MSGNPFKTLKLDITFDVNIPQCSSMFPEYQPYGIANLDDFYSKSKIKKIYMDPSENELKPNMEPHMANYVIKSTIDMSDAKIEKSFYTRYYSYRKIVGNPNLIKEDKLEDMECYCIPKDSKIIVECFAVHRNEIQFPTHVMVGAAQFNLHDLRSGKAIKEDLMAHESMKVGDIIIKAAKFKLNNGYKWENTTLKNYTAKDTEKIAMKHAERCYNWFSKFEFPVAVSRRINCYFNFSVFGKGMPASFITSRVPYSNSLFMENVSCKAIKRFLIRKQIVNPMKRTSFPKEYLDIMFRKFSSHDKLAVMAEMLFIPSTSLNYIGDHIFTKNGQRIAVEDFNRGVLIGKGGDCEGKLF